MGPHETQCPSRAWPWWLRACGCLITPHSGVLGLPSMRLRMAGLVPLSAAVWRPFRSHLSLHCPAIPRFASRHLQQKAREHRARHAVALHARWEASIASQSSWARQAGASTKSHVGPWSLRQPCTCWSIVSDASCTRRMEMRAHHPCPKERIPFPAPSPPLSLPPSRS